MKWSRAGSGITDIAVCIVRYFGGTLLGTGGLVKAYGDSAKEVLRIVPTEELVDKTRFRMLLPYNAYTQIKRLISASEAVIDSEKFDTMIGIEGTVPSAKLGALKAGTDDIGQGRILFEELST